MHILISGAGIAGLSATLDLAARGHRVTVVERAAHFRVNGSPIDIRGDAIDITERMGLLPRVRERRVRTSELIRFVDADGEPVARLPLAALGDSDDDIEIPREDLAGVLVDALPADATVRFRDSVDALTDDGAGVDVRFASGRAERFDLVVGADGQHSGVRGLVFGPEREHARHLGVYVAVADLPGAAGADLPNPIYNFPGHLAGITRYRDRALAVLMFRSEPLDHDHRDLAAQKEILRARFAGHPEWEVPRLLDAVLADPELYFDSASQIHLPAWHRGRVVLVGDAAHCASGLSGRGTSLALTGAYFLAEELDRAGGDHVVAFERYEARQRPYAESGQQSVGTGADIVLPPTWEAIAARNERLRAMVG
ncbi:FAD-dependent oxidoreductase [Saccharothrix australiensis]|uniref:2-polyprenyl-6-methoxyphenol hydroxylase-like FAD-dependent oxidoreductase n=1 Tax=Saccharothrix australiensis TaxID=2072 RepID=A0A495W181_9PSEU|nr:FAD-dependent oxidoreductase [Saccharothrix australiensis]RKT54757.1 2-polyprenyl-6-methoxyphenol hydroxylase-like FAD-dependent oxidoreductase [Saccharothrix australiensis]